MRRLSRFFELSPAERHQLMVAALLLGLIKMGLMVLPFQRLQNILARLARSKDQSILSSDEQRELVVRAVVTASRHMPFSLTCLPQALATFVLLSRQGYSARVHFGVAKDVEGRLEAHAWVECQGQIVIGGAERERFTPLVALEGKSV